MSVKLEETKDFVEDLAEAATGIHRASGYLLFVASVAFAILGGLYLGFLIVDLDAFTPEVQPAARAAFWCFAFAFIGVALVATCAGQMRSRSAALRRDAMAVLYLAPEETVDIDLPERHGR